MTSILKGIQERFWPCVQWCHNIFSSVFSQRDICQWKFKEFILFPSPQFVFCVCGIGVWNMDQQVTRFLTITLVVPFSSENKTSKYLQYHMLSFSLGLISDSFHMFFDCTALLAGLIASVIARWGKNERFSYGWVYHCYYFCVLTQAQYAYSDVLVSNDLFVRYWHKFWGRFFDSYFDAWYLSVKTQTKRNFLCPYYMASLGPLIVPIWLPRLFWQKINK